MYETAVLMTVILMLVSAVDYVRRAWIRETNPVLASWILIVVTMGLSFSMYWQSPKRSWTGNIGLISALVNVLIILGGVIAANIRYGTLKVAFDRTQKWCLAGGAGITVFWLFTGSPLVSYIMVQGIALLGYFATAKRLWKAERSTEPLFLWIAVFCATLCAIYPASIKNDTFSWIFLGRAGPSTLFLIYLIVRIKKKTQKEKPVLSPLQ